MSAIAFSKRLCTAGVLQNEVAATVDRTAEAGPINDTLTRSEALGLEVSGPPCGQGMIPLQAIFCKSANLQMNQLSDFGK